MTAENTMDFSVTHILYCTDFSEEGDRAFPYAVGMAVAHQAKLTLLHVIPAPDAQFWKAYIYEVDHVDRKAKADIDAKMATFRDQIPAGLEFSIKHKIGREDEEILLFAEENRTDFIILSRPPHSVLGGVFFGNLPEKIVRHAHCPVLIMP